MAIDTALNWFNINQGKVDFFARSITGDVRSTIVDAKILLTIVRGRRNVKKQLLRAQAKGIAFSASRTARSNTRTLLLFFLFFLFFLAFAVAIIDAECSRPREISHLCTALRTKK